MANMLFANNCNTTLNGGITAIATSMVVTSATGFPSPTGSQYFYCTLADAATQTTIEIVKVTAVSGTTFTIVRGQDGTTGTAFSSGAVISLRLVRASLNDFPKLDEANTFTGLLTANSFASSSATITGGTLNGVAIGGTTAGDGTFDILTANVTNLTNVTSSAGIAITGTFTGSSPTDGLVMDYATGWGRFSDFGGDGFQWFNNGLATNKLMELSSAGALTTTSTVTANGVLLTGNLGTVTSVTGTSPVVSSGGTTPVISMPAATTSVSGYLTNTDWTTFNSKAPGVTFTTGYVPFGQGTTTLNQSANLFWDNTNARLGVNTTSPANSLNIVADNTPYRGQLSLQTVSAANFAQISFYDRTTLSAQIYQEYGGSVLNILTSVSSPIAFGTNGTERMRLFASGGVSIGNTTDPGATNLSVTGSLKLGSGTPLTTYLEGSWTPTQGAGLTVIGTFSSVGTYVRIGRQVTVSGYVQGSTSIAAAANQILVGGLPFTADSNAPCFGNAVNSFNVTSVNYVSSTNVYLTATALGPTTAIYFSLTYFV